MRLALNNASSRQQKTDWEGGQLAGDRAIVGMMTNQTA
jgi:hypothetical protein